MRKNRIKGKATRAQNWCFDFGGLKEVRTWLHSCFDHTMIVAEDDHLSTFQKFDSENLVDLRTLPAVGCEAVAKFVHDYVQLLYSNTQRTAFGWNPLKSVSTLEILRVISWLSLRETWFSVQKSLPLGGMPRGNFVKKLLAR